MQVLPRLGAISMPDQQISDDAKLITQKARRDKMKYGESKVKINAAIG